MQLRGTNSNRLQMCPPAVQRPWAKRMVGDAADRTHCLTDPGVASSSQTIA